MKGWAALGGIHDDLKASHSTFPSATAQRFALALLERAVGHLRDALGLLPAGLARGQRRLCRRRNRSVLTSVVEDARVCFEDIVAEHVRSHLEQDVVECLCGSLGVFSQRNTSFRSLERHTDIDISEVKT